MMIRKRTRASLDSAIVDVWKREIGQISVRNFAHRLAASEDLVLRLGFLRKLDKHRGCVNTVSFSAAGDILVSGSDDRRIILWDWETGLVKLSFHSGHHNNVFQARIMPNTEDSIVTCAADGQVRHAQILECGKVETHLLAKHQGRAHKLAVEPGSPHIFYTCGEDGLVQHIDLRTRTATPLFTCITTQNQSHSSIIHLNAIAIDPRNPNLFAVGGSDQFARLFDIRKYKWDGSSEFDRPVDFFCPPHLIDDEHVGITGLAFSDQSELLVSYNDEFIYLFSRDIGLGPDPTLTSQVSDGSGAVEMIANNHSGSSLSNVDSNVKAAPQAYKGHRNCETVKGVNFFGPKSEYVVSGSDCGRIFFWKKKGGELIRVIEADKHVVNCIEGHPHATVLASSGIEHDIKIWTPNSIDRATLPTNIQKDLVLNSEPRRNGLFPFGGFYDDDDDDDSDDIVYLDDDDDEDGDDDDCDDDEDDDDDDSDGDNGNHDDYVTDSDEVLNEELHDEEEEGEENGGADFIFLGDTDVSSVDFGSEDLNDDEDEDDGGFENGEFDSASDDDSLVDICDIDDYSDFGGGGNDFDDRTMMRRPRRKGRMHLMVSPEDLMLQLFSQQRNGNSPTTTTESSGEHSDMGRDLLHLLLAFDTNSDGSSDDDGDTTSTEYC